MTIEKMLMSRDGRKIFSVFPQQTYLPNWNEGRVRERESKGKRDGGKRREKIRRRLVQSEFRRLVFWLDSLFLFSLFRNDITVIVIKKIFFFPFGRGDFWMCRWSEWNLIAFGGWYFCFETFLGISERNRNHCELDLEIVGERGWKTKVKKWNLKDFWDLKNLEPSINPDFLSVSETYTFYHTSLLQRHPLRLIPILFSTLRN